METTAEFLKRGGKITVIAPNKAKRSLGFQKMGYKFSERHLGKTYKNAIAKVA